MTKYKVTDNTSTAGSQVTLTSYMITNLPEKVQEINDPTKQPQSTITKWYSQFCQRTFRKKLIYKRIPILKWLPNYNREAAICDLISGLTVGLTVIPQGIAYSSIAGLPPQIGLYSSFLACFVYTVFGSCKEAPIGPTAITGLLTGENVHNFGPQGAVLLCFLTGCVQFLMGVLQLGFLIDFISGPVSIGFTSAIAIIIATTQVKDVLGLSYPGGKFLQVWEQIFEHISETRIGDCILGVTCIGILLILRTVKNVKVGPEDSKKRIHKIVGNLLWLLSTGRNIIVVIVSALLAYIFELHDSKPFILTGEIKAGLPSFQPPTFQIKVDNETISFSEITSTIGSGIIIVPLLGILENIALAKVFANGKTVDATQEMLALGACNIASSFVQAMPVSGALSRGAVNYSTGVKTTFGGIYTGLIVILALQWFTPYCSYIPKASLAAVIIAAVVFMVEFHVVKPIWRTKKSDLIPAFSTFVCSLFLRLEIGIAVGVGINLIFLLYAIARPSVDVQEIENYMDGKLHYLLITPDRSLTFPSVEYVRYVISKAGIKQGSSSIPVVIDAKHIQGADFTAARGIKSLIEDFTKRSQPILFYNLKPSIISIFEGVQPKDFIYCKSVDELNALLKQYSDKQSLENNVHLTYTL